MLIAKLVSAFEGVDFFQYQPILEHVPILWRLGVLDTNSAAIFWRLNASMAVLDRATGRNLNFRLEDSSSISKALDADRYLERARDPDFDGLLKRFNEDSRVPAFLTHETLPHAELIFLAAPEARIVEVERNLADLAFSWFQRGWGVRFGSDEKALIPVVAVDGNPTPWFATDFAETFGQSYAAMSPADRCAASILTLHRESQRALAKLPEDQSRRVHVISYETLLCDPHGVMDGIGAFLETEPLPGMSEVLAREGLTGSEKTNPKSSRKALGEVVSPALAASLDAAMEQQVAQKR